MAVFAQIRMYSTEAIILKKEPYGEADLMITALTKNFGKIKLMAQGARKQEAKLKGHLEPLSHSVVSFVIGRNFYRLTSAELLSFFPALRNGVLSLGIGFHIRDLIDSNVFEEKNEPRIFELFYEFLRVINSRPLSGKEELQNALLDFYAGFLDILGMLPEKKPSVKTINYLAEQYLGFKPEAVFDIMENRQDMSDI